MIISIIGDIVGYSPWQIASNYKIVNASINKHVGGSQGIVPVNVVN